MKPIFLHALFLVNSPLPDFEAGGADDIIIGIELHLQGIHGLGLCEVGPEEVDAVIVGEWQPGPAVPLPDAVGERDDPPVEDLHIHGTSGNQQLQHTEEHYQLSRMAK